MTFLYHLLLALSDRDDTSARANRYLRARVAELEAELVELRAYKRATAGRLFRGNRGQVEA
jgi:hypothetical protein